MILSMEDFDIQTLHLLSVADGLQLFFSPLIVWLIVLLGTQRIKAPCVLYHQPRETIMTLLKCQPIFSVAMFQFK